MPGLGKTLLVRTIADVIDCAFNRIQFTPDLMPADITGTNILVEEEGRRVFRFQSGPIFANLVLADEINRATPKTQSSLLEAMQEHQVTVARNRYPLDPPFFVLATQNPLEMEGTYPLPEAQLDRFLFKVMVPFPSEEDLITIMDRTTGADAPTASKVCTRGRDRRDAAARPGGADRAARHGLRRGPAQRDPPGSAARAGARPRVRPLRRLAARRPGAGDRGQDLRPPRRPVQRVDRRRPGRGAPVAPAPRDPQLRGRGRGHHPGGDRPIRPGRRPRPVGRVAPRSPRASGPGDAWRWTASRARRLPVPQPPAAEPGARGRARPAFLPSDVDPTVFDEGFLRQLERLLVLMKAPVRGGLKGGRRSVKRGQSVEFADFRDYTLGDDLRQLDWNVLARLEKLFIKLYVEEEDVTIHFLLDASASMESGHPSKLLFAKRAAAALGYIGLASEDRVAITSLGGRAGRRQVALRGSGRVFRLLSALSGIAAADGPTDLMAAARHAGAQLTGRGVIVLLSDLLDPNADRVIRELAATGSELIVLHLLSPAGARPGAGGRPPARGRRVRRGHRRHRRTSRPWTGTRLAWRRGGRASPTSPRGAGRPTCRSPRTWPLTELMFAELRRRQVVG